MKNYLKKVGTFFTVLVFIIMFFEINFLSFVTIMGFKLGKAEYYLPSGEKINVDDLKDYEYRYISAPFVKAVEPIMDSWMRTDPRFADGKFRQTYLPDKRKLNIRLKKIDEFRKEQLMVIPLAAVSHKKDYFESMNYVCGQVDKVISREPLPLIAEKLYNDRRGKARLRPLLSYLAYDLAGGASATTATMLAAISETTNLHLYCHNYLLDDKKLEIKNQRMITLLSGGQFFSDLTTRLICKTKIPNRTKVLILNRLAKEIDLTYLGQIADEELNVKNYPSEEAEYLAAYEKRSVLMSGPMYGFSLWLAYAAVGKFDLAETAYDFGKNLGLTLQIVNDIADLSAKKSDAFADWQKGKVTAPLYYIQKYFPEKTLTRDNLSQLLVNSNAYDSSLELVRAAQEKTRGLLTNLTGDDSHLINRVLMIGKDNKYFRQLKQMRNGVV